MHKLYCYVDESGQDTSAHKSRREIFCVAVAVFADNRDELEQACIEYERISGKRKKWHKARRQNRLNYIRLVINDDRFRGTLCFSSANPHLDLSYDARTILGIVKAIQWKQPPAPYTAEIYVDGLTTAKQAEYSLELRQAGVHGCRVHRARDESYALIRLADALAGLAREAIEGKDEEALALMRQAIRKGMIAEV